MRIFDENFIDDVGTGDLTESSESTYLPAVNILDPIWTKPWRTAAGTAHTLDIDFTTAQGFTAAAILLDATTAITSVTVGFDDNASFTSPTTKTIISGAPSHGVGVVTFDTVTERYARITINLGSSGVANVYRAHLGTFWAPDNTQLLNYTMEYLDRSVQKQNGYGQRFTDEKTGLWRTKFGTSYTDETERENWVALAKDYGLKKHLFMSYDYTNYPQTQTFYGKFSKVGRQRLVAAGATPYWRNEGWEFEGVREVE
jgi:hypothetical protein